MQRFPAKVSFAISKNAISGFFPDTFAQKNYLLILALLICTHNFEFRKQVCLQPTLPHFINGLLTLEMTIFSLKITVKSLFYFHYFVIERAPSEIPANLPGQFSLSGLVFLYWAAATLKSEGARSISK